jgi:uncharacterized membrane protein YdbT with pleckstrin-like domain
MSSPAYRQQQTRIARRARERAIRRYRVPAILLFAAGLLISYLGQGPWAVALAVLLGMAAVFLYRIDQQLRRKA